MATRAGMALRAILDRAFEEAHELNSPTVEAEHLLLAIAAGESPAAGVLRAAGLTRASIVEALQREATASLAAVGVAESFYGELAPTKVDPQRVRMAASAKRAIEMATRIAVDNKTKTITAPHLLLALLAAKRGTVPRALALADIDVSELRDRVAEQLSAGTVRPAQRR